MVPDACPLCERHAQIDAGGGSDAVARLPTGYVMLNPTQYHRGYTFFSCVHCVAELHELEPASRSQHLDEMAIVAEAVFRAFAPGKLNYELLGNTVPHLHWHLVPRHDDDPELGAPIWEDHRFLQVLHSGRGVASGDVLRGYGRDLLRALDEIGAPVVRRDAEE